MTAVMVRMDSGGEAKPLGMVLLDSSRDWGLRWCSCMLALSFWTVRCTRWRPALDWECFALSIKAVRLMKAGTV